MFIVIAGGGRTGAQLARYLIDEGHQVHVLENRKEVLARSIKSCRQRSFLPGIH